MESRVRLLVLAAVVPMVLLIVGIAYWLYVSLNAPVVVGPEPTAPPAATAPPTLTPTATNTPVVVAIPTVTPPPPTSTPSPTVTTTRTAAPTVVPSATNTRVPVRTPTDTPAPTNTPQGGQYPYRIEAGPVLDSNRACAPQNIVYGWIKARDGSGLPGMRLRYVPKYGGIPELPAITRTGTQAGYYELTLGTAGNEWDIFMVDENDNPISPTAHFAVLQTESGQCWWQLIWIQR